MRIIPEAAIAIIKRFEGLRLTAYRCPAGKPTIGWGHTEGVTAADIGQRTITEAEAEELLQQDLATAAEAVDALITHPINDNQRGALISFVFNLGSGRLRTSTLRQKINDGHIDAASVEFARWVYSGGKRLEGLVARRQAEAELFAA